MPLNLLKSLRASNKYCLFLAVCCLLFLASACRPASKTVLVLGDSLSAGYGLQAGSGWVTLLERRVKTDNIPAKIINASLSGDTTKGGMARLPLLLAKHQPAVVIIELGGNDGLRSQSLIEAEENLRVMIKAANLSGATVLLVGMQIPPHTSQDYANRFAALYGKIAADTKVALVPFMLEGLINKPELFMEDRIHPTAAAQPIILDNIWPHLMPLLK